MKNLKNSFLFLFLIVFSFEALAQQDSLSIYRSKFLTPKSESDLTEAYSFFKHYHSQSLQKKDTAAIIYALSCLSQIELKWGGNYESEDLATQALELVDEAKDLRNREAVLTSIYNHLGKLYRRKVNMEKGLDAYDKALTYAASSRDSATILNNISTIYKDEKYFIKSQEVLLKALEVVKRSNDTVSLALILDNLGFAKFNINPKAGKQELDRALELRKGLDKFDALLPSYLNLGRYFAKNNKIEVAKNYLQMADSLARKTKNKDYRINTLGELVLLEGDDLDKEYVRLSEEVRLFNQRKDNKNAYLKYNTKRQERIAEMKELEAEKANERSLLFQILSIFVLLISIIGYFLYRERNKKKLVENVIQTEGRISKTVHDVIANDIYQIMTKLQIEKNSKAEILDDLDVVYNKARDISRNNFVIDDSIEYSEIIGDLLKSYESMELRLITNGLKKIDWSRLTIHKRNMLYRVLKELLTNMTKYSKASLVTIVFEEKGNGVFIKYKDNGVGCDFVKKNGLVNAENRIKSVGGTITFESEPNNGFLCKIKL
ncbi:tetratricopeptide repeat-containing sensor histidine kinase [Tenacibaculum xiamenense]|uniref:tetratricopeptide repeat-containing sensor histidine kinase n=1 Tax=Tenacibaculum xiamenense TaxID=1261553 RepID=UPI003895CA3C